MKEYQQQSQSVMHVVHPKTKNPGVIVVNHIKGLDLVLVDDLFEYEVGGMTKRIYRRMCEWGLKRYGVFGSEPVPNTKRYVCLKQLRSVQATGEPPVVKRVGRKVYV